ncbi:MAG: S41 family peptidase [Eubacteriales bacterium]|nr:S41 family peptidase [Eubacteriales bacterium]
MNEPNQTTGLPDLSHQPTKADTGRPHSHLGRTILVVLITMALTFTLTVSGGVFVLLQAGVSLLPGQNDQSLGIQFGGDEETRTALNKLRSVYDTLDKNYYKDLTDAEMLAAMTSGLVNEMDSPYTMYLDAEQTQQIAESMSGNYVGIGAIVAFNTAMQVEITEVIEDSPAEEADLRAGDIFIAVDGESVEMIQDITQLAILVRGTEGTLVELEMYRPSANRQFKIQVERRSITSASVSHRMLDPEIGYVRISEFSTGVADLFIRAVEDLKSQGARHIVFDLRNNSGGLANEVIAMLDYVLPKTEIARIEGRQDGKLFTQEWTSDASMGVPADMRYAILINEFSASASELFTGCLRDLDLAEVIGIQSFGKGSGTLTFNLADGSSVNVTNFLYYLPGGSSIEGVGLEPDRIVELPEQAAGKSIPQLTAEEDTQLAAAVTYLESLPGDAS